MNIQFTGKIIEAEPLQQGVSKRDGAQWTAQNYVIEELNQQYPSQCVFKVFGSDKIQQFGIRVGEVLTVHLGIKANKNNGRWFNSLDCWKVDRFGAQQQAYQQTQTSQPFPQQPPTYQGQMPPQQQGYQQSQGNLPF